MSDNVSRPVGASRQGVRTMGWIGDAADLIQRLYEITEPDQIPTDNLDVYWDARRVVVVDSSRNLVVVDATLTDGRINQGSWKVL